LFATLADMHSVDRLLLRLQMQAHNALGAASYGLTHYRHPVRVPVMAAVRQAKSMAETATTPLECAELFNAVRAAEPVSGDMAELGVFQGGTSALMLAASSAKHLHLFDTFSGLPAGEGGLEAGDYAASLVSVRRRLSTYADRVTFHPGFFPASATEVEDACFSFVHLDVDLYESTLAGLEFFWPRMTVGGIVLSHDYPTLDGVVRAFSEFFAAKPVPVIPLSGFNCLVVKTS
jgi:O-methyltransferase